MFVGGATHGLGGRAISNWTGYCYGTMEGLARSKYYVDQENMNKMDSDAARKLITKDPALSLSMPSDVPFRSFIFFFSNPLPPPPSLFDPRPRTSVSARHRSMLRSHPRVGNGRAIHPSRD